MANVFTNVGRKWVADKLREADSAGAGIFNRNIDWGTGAGTANITDTTLFTEAGEVRVVGTMSSQTTTVTGDTYQVVGTMTATAGKTVTNAGVFDTTTKAAGDMLIKGDHAGVPLLTNDSVEYTFKLQFSTA